MIQRKIKTFRTFLREVADIDLLKIYAPYAYWVISNICI